LDLERLSPVFSPSEVLYGIELISDEPFLHNLAMAQAKDSDSRNRHLLARGSKAKEGPLVGLTRVGFLGRLFPFALARTAGRLALAPFDPLSFPLFLPLALLDGRLLTCGRKLLWPLLWPQCRLRPCLP
jgi:hypothetical protein